MLCTKTRKKTQKHIKHVDALYEDQKKTQKHIKHMDALSEEQMKKNTKTHKTQTVERNFKMRGKTKKHTRNTCQNQKQVEERKY